MKRSSGMTLIELLAALTLSAMLMAVLLGLVSQQNRTGQEMVSKFPFETAKEILINRMEQDYLGCHHILVYPNRLVMHGFSRRAEAGSIAGSIPSRVEYLINSDSGNLSRKQTNLDTSARETSQRFALSGVSRFVARTALDTDVAPRIFMADIELLDGSKPIHVNLVR